jgi:YodL-like
MKLKYEIWLNWQLDKEGRPVAMIAGYEKHDPLVLAYADEIDIGDRIGKAWACEQIFNRFNVDHPSRYHNRSLSVGDVVYFPEVDPLHPDEPRAFAVEKQGFKDIEVPRFAKMPIPTEHRTVCEVLRDVNVRLHHEGIDAGESDWSDMTRWNRGEPHDYNYSMPWPERARWIVAYPVTGSNEGYYGHLEAIYQPSTLFGEDLEKAKKKDPNTFGVKEGRFDRRIPLGQAKTWEWDNAWQIAKRTAELLGV